MANIFHLTPESMSENDAAGSTSTTGHQMPLPGQQYPFPHAPFPNQGFPDTSFRAPFPPASFLQAQAPSLPAPTHPSSGPASAPFVAPTPPVLAPAPPVPAPAPAPPTNMAAPGPVQQQPPAPGLASRAYDVGEPRRVGRKPAQDDPNLPEKERLGKARNRASQQKHREKKAKELVEAGKAASDAQAELEQSQQLVAALAQENQLLKARLAELEAQARVIQPLQARVAELEAQLRQLGIYM